MRVDGVSGEREGGMEGGRAGGRAGGREGGRDDGWFIRGAQCSSEPQGRLIFPDDLTMTLPLTG